jgi:hypothetical protein
MRKNESEGGVDDHSEVLYRVDIAFVKVTEWLDQPRAPPDSDYSRRYA